MRSLTILLVLAAFSTGCGSDDEDAPVTRGGESQTAAEPRTTESERGEGRTGETSEEAETGPSETSTSGGEEDVEGGPGDEVAARVPAMFRVTGGRLRPATVRVPPYIAVSVEVRSPDEIALVVVGRRGRNAEPGKPARFRLAGLRPGRSVRVRLATGAEARITASAEPGP